MIEYKVLDESYLESLSALERQCQQDPWSTSLIAKELKSPRTTVEGMFVDGQLVAYLVYQTVLDEVHILNFGVKRQLRRQGLGRTFMLYALAEFRAQDMGVVMLEVRESNIPAQALYRSVGFDIAGHREQYYSNKENAVLMMLRLDDDDGADDAQRS